MHHPLTARAYRLVILWALSIGSIPIVAGAQSLRQINEVGAQAILAKSVIDKVGAKNPDVTIVEYFDYNCPYCKRIVPTFTQLLAADKGIAIVYKDWPVLGEASQYAANCALAAQWQHKYLAAHDALLAGSRLSSQEVVDSVLRAAGIDMEKLKRDLSAHSNEIVALLARNDSEANALEFDGTPGIVVGKLVLPGGAELGVFQKLIAQIRSGSR